MRRQVLMPTILVLALIVAGCTGGGGDPLASSPGASGMPGGNPGDPGGTDSSGPTSSAPPVQGTSRVRVDPNATFDGAAHMHDWWGGATELVILDRNLELPVHGVCVGEPTVFGCNGAPEQTRFIRLESDPNPNVRPNIVYQGTGTVVVTVTVGQVILPFVLNTFGPGIKLDSQRLIVDQPKKTFTIGPLNDTYNDPPHTRISGWYWRLESTATSGTPKTAFFRGPLHVEVKVLRDTNRTLPIDPPHPDHWNGTTRLVLIEKTTQHRTQAGTQQTGFYYYPLYAYDTGSGCTGTACRIGVAPEINHTVPILSGRIEVTLRWTNTASSTPTKLALEYCAPPYDCLYTVAKWTRVPVQTDGTSERVFGISVREDQWDTPYTLAGAKGTFSKWRFRWNAESSIPGSVALFQGDVSWLVEVYKVGN